MATVRFGVNSRLSLPADVLVAGCGDSAAAPLRNPEETVRAALQDPLDFPALKETLVPGDRVALALEEGLPRAPKIVAGVIQELLEAGVDPQQIQVLQTVNDARLSRVSPTRDLPPAVGQQVELVRHDPSDRERLSYLAMSQDEQPIYMNREICDADLVLPIGCLKPSESLGYLGVHGTLFPTYSDLDTQRRFRAPRSSLSAKDRRRRADEAREAAWLLGIRMTIQLIPGSGDQLLHVLAGDADAVESRGRQICEQVWKLEVPRRASLVVATISGGRRQQTWSSFARTLSAALRIVEDDGAIAICSDLKIRPGRSLRRLADAPSLMVANRAIHRDRTRDALPALQLVRALQRTKVYLLSRLDEQVVEELGLAYVASAEEIGNLVNRHQSCIVLQDAQQAVPSVAGE